MQWGEAVFSIFRRKFFLRGLAKVSTAGQRAFGSVWGRGRRTKAELLPGEKRYSRQRQLKWTENPVWAPSIQSTILSCVGIKVIRVWTP